MKLNVWGKAAYCYTGGKPFNTELPTAVFVHGAQNDHSVWALQTRYFAHHGFGVLAVDLPGHGFSEGRALTTIEQMSDWLQALLDAAGVTRAMLIGHSMGSLISLETAFRVPARVDRLALVGTAFPMKVADMLLDAAKNEVQRAIDMVNIWSHSTIAAKPSAPAPGFYIQGGSQRLMQRIWQRHGDQVFHGDLAACNAYANGMTAAASVTCPTLFLLGKNDMMTQPRFAQPLAKAIPHAHMQVLESCGHALMSEQPDLTLEALMAFARA